MTTRGGYTLMPVAWIWGASFLVLVLSIIARVLVYDTVTSDYTYFLSQWFEMLRTHPGLTAFQWPFSDYSPGYLYLIKFVTYLPLSSLYSIKTISVICDAIIAVYVARTWALWRPMSHISERVLVGTLVFAIPTAIANGALWGQSDAVYAAGVVAAFYYMLTNRPFACAVAFGLAISIKLQAIFFAPVIVGYLAYRRASLDYLFAIPLVYVLTVLPVWAGGGSVPFWLTTYMRQTGTYTDLSVSAPSLYAFVMPYPLSDDARQWLVYLGIAVAALIGAAVTWYVWRTWRTRPTYRALILITLMCVLALPLVLPRMHERYFYLVDIYAVMYALYVPQRWFIPVAAIAASLMSYTPFLGNQVALLSGVMVDLRIPALIFLAILGVLLYDLLVREKLITPRPWQRTPKAPTQRGVGASVSSRSVNVRERWLSLD